MNKKFFWEKEKVALQSDDSAILSSEPSVEQESSTEQNIDIQPHKRNGLRYDPIQDDPEIKKIIDKVDIEVNGLDNEHYRLGDCHAIWNRKKKILKERYGIDWKTPSEMNQGVMFD